MKRLSSLFLLGSLALALPAPLRAQCFEDSITSPEATLHADFGTSVALEGSTLVVGAAVTPSAPGGNYNGGAAYVYEDVGSGWVLQQKLTASDGFQGQSFGRSVVLRGDTIVVGADGGNGAAYVFEHVGTVWSETQKLAAPQGGGGWSFEFAERLLLDEEADDLYVVQPGDSGLSTQERVFAFHKDALGWALDAEIDPDFHPSYGVPQDEMSVDLEGVQLFVGNGKDAPLAPGATQHGAVFVFEKPGAAWIKMQELRLASNNGNVGFGKALDAEGTFLAVGADAHVGEAVPLAGAVVIFERIGGSWTQTQVLQPPADDQHNLGRFGHAVKLDGERLYVTATWNLLPGPGKLYVYDRAPEGFRLVTTIDSPGVLADDDFGRSLALDGGRLVIGETHWPSTGPPGVVWIFDVATEAASIFCQTSPNSAGDGALIGATGSPRIADGSFTLEVREAPPNKIGKFYYGPIGIQVPFGDGSRCVGAGMSGTFRLYPLLPTDGSGHYTRPVDFMSPPTGAGPGAIAPGSTWRFQYWFRDPQGPGGTGHNLSDGLSVTFCP